MNYYGIYQTFIDIDFEEKYLLISVEKALSPLNAIDGYVNYNFKKEKRNFIKGYLSAIECSKKAYDNILNSTVITNNKERLGIWA